MTLSAKLQSPHYQVPFPHGCRDLGYSQPTCLCYPYFVLDPLYHFCKLPWDLVIRIPRFELSKEAACFLPPPSALSRVGTAILTKAMDTLPEPQQEVMQSQAVLPQLLLVPPFPFHQTILHTFQYSCDQRISECFTLISCF